MKSREIPDKAAVLASDESLEKWGGPLWHDCPRCPQCNHLHTSHWNGGMEDVHWGTFHGTRLSWNDGDDGDTEEVKCPKCEIVYVVTQHVERIVKRTASVTNCPTS